MLSRLAHFALVLALALCGVARGRAHGVASPTDAASGGHELAAALTGWARTESKRAGDGRVPKTAAFDLVGVLPVRGTIDACPEPSRLSLPFALAPAHRSRPSARTSRGPPSSSSDLT